MYSWRVRRLRSDREFPRQFAEAKQLVRTTRPGLSLARRFCRSAGAGDPPAHRLERLERGNVRRRRYQVSAEARRRRFRQHRRLLRSPGNSPRSGLGLCDSHRRGASRPSSARPMEPLRHLRSRRSCWHKHRGARPSEREERESTLGVVLGVRLDKAPATPDCTRLSSSMSVVSTIFNSRFNASRSTRCR